MIDQFGTPGVPDPEDVTAEVFLRVVQDVGKFDGDEANFRSWVFVIAHHRMVDDRRRRIRHPEATLYHPSGKLK